MSGRSAIARRKVNGAGSKDKKGKGVDIPSHLPPLGHHSSPPLPSEQLYHHSPPYNVHYAHYPQQLTHQQHLYDYSQPRGIDYAVASISSTSPPTSLGTGIGTTSGRFLQFSNTESYAPSPAPYVPHLVHPRGPGSFSAGAVSSAEGGPSSLGYPLFSTAGPRNGSLYSEEHLHPLYYYPFGLPPTSRLVETEDLPVIEKSNLRVALDKRSDDVRKGLAKTFAFRRKASTDKGAKVDGSEAHSVVELERQETLGGSARNEGPHPSGRDVSAPTTAVHPFGLEATHEEDPMRVGSAAAEPATTASSADLYGGGPSRSPPVSPGQRPAWMEGSTNGRNEPTPTQGLAVTGDSTQASPPTFRSDRPEVKRWVGDEKYAIKWKKLQIDPELWDPNGDVLVYLCSREEGAHHASPSFRLSSHVIKATGSSYFTEMMVEIGGGSEIARSRSADGEGNPRPTTSITSPSTAQRPPEDISHGRRRGSKTADLGDQEEGSGHRRTGSAVMYEMYLPPPSDLTTEETLRYDLATRNVFAMLYHASILGTTLYTALTDVLERLELVMAPGSDNLGLVLCHLLSDGMDDVRGNANTAISLMAFCEHPNVRWEGGWAEFFSHAVGIIGSSPVATAEIIEGIEDYPQLCSLTRGMMDRAILDIQVRIQVAETRIADFAMRDVFRSQKGSVESSVVMAKAAGARLRDMLIQHYSKLYGSWPPATAADTSVSESGSARGSGEGILWLNRPIAMTLARDFGLLWEHLVDREVVWDAEIEAGREIMVDLRQNKNAERGALGNTRQHVSDVEGFPMTDMLLKFDKANRYSHIPHPFPLVPELESGCYTERGEVPILERETCLAYTKATNIDSFAPPASQKPTNSSTDLIDAYMRLEMNDQSVETDPQIARLGRWLVIYGVLQTLAEVSVDASWLRWKDGVRYHLGIRLSGKGMVVPPWAPSLSDGIDVSKATSGTGSPLVTSHSGGEHERSWCWEAAERWTKEKLRASKTSSAAGRKNESWDRKAPASQLNGKGKQGQPISPSVTPPSSTPLATHGPNPTILEIPLSDQTHTLRHTGGQHFNNTIVVERTHAGGSTSIAAIPFQGGSGPEVGRGRSASTGSSISSSTKSEFEFPTEWDIFPSRESLVTGSHLDRVSMSKGSAMISLMERAETLRSDSPILG